MSDLEAVIFDFDGVLLDTSDQLYLGYKRVLARFGIEYQESQFNENYGLKTKEHFNKILLENNIELPDDELNKLVVERDEVYREKCKEVSKPLPGVKDLLDELSEQNIKLGVASSTSRDNLDYFLPKIGIQKHFESTLAGTEVTNGKPDPEVYLKLCEQLDAEPTLSIGVEDTDKGVAALKNAGMMAVAVTLTNRKNYDFSKADLIVKTLNDVNLTILVPLIIKS
ncbi:HAD family hydrolase [[Eubacterium] cellulosolvens]